MSPQDASTRGYLAQVIAEGPVYGTDANARSVLGALATPYLGRVIRWVRQQAVRVADGLDPDPQTPWCGALRGVECATINALGDAPTVLRQWARSDEARQAAYEALRAGVPFSLATADHTGRYVLAVWPVDVPVTAVTGPSGAAPPTNTRPDRNSHRKPHRKMGRLFAFLRSRRAH